jgi:hypothetical protein
VRSDPSDTGGLFIGRRPGTRKVKYRAAPERGSSRRQHADDLVAFCLLGVMALICLCFWGPLPAGWLWVGSHVQVLTDSVSLALFVAFLGLLLCLLAALAVCKRIDQAWILVRRAAGHDQREGVIGKVFAITCATGAIIFSGWLIFFSGAHLTGGGISL